MASMWSMKNSSIAMHGYNVRWDRDQWIVSRPTSTTHEKSKGKEGRKDLSYHAKLEYAMGWIINRALGEAGIETIDEVYQFMTIQPEVIRRSVKQCVGLPELLLEQCGQ